MTQVEKIQKDIQDMETALSMPSINDMPKVKKRLEADLRTAKSQLDSLQKKSQGQPIRIIEELERAMREHAKNVGSEDFEMLVNLSKRVSELLVESMISEDDYKSLHLRIYKEEWDKKREGRNDLADKVEQEVQNMHRDQIESAEAFDQRVEWEKREGFQTTYTAPQPQIKTVKAPDFEDDYADLINVTLTNSKGDKFVRTHTKAQVKANCRKYFANVLQTRINGNDKLGVGFKNLLAYFVAWMELNQVAPELKDVLQDYSKYKRGDEKQEPSEAFKIAQQLYAKLISLTTKKEKAEGGQ